VIFRRRVQSTVRVIISSGTENPGLRMRELQVWKFGGTSLGNGELIRNAAKLVAEALRTRDLVVVCSAMGHTTDRLMAVADAASRGDAQKAIETVRELREEHLKACREAVDDVDVRREVESFVTARTEELEKVATSASLLREVTERTRDLIASFGERLSTKIFWGALRSMGVDAVYLEGGEAGIVTDDAFGNANPLMPLTAQLLRERLGKLLSDGKVPVVTGYIAANRDGVTTTLGRGGSDYTATLIAYSLDAKEVWLWTDVDGMMSADPRVVRTAKVLRRISYEEAVEMAYFGAKGLQIRTILPAKEKGIPIRIKNTFNPGAEGTVICDSTDKEMGVTKAVLFTKNVSMLTVKGDVLKGGALSARVLAVLEQLKVVPLMISQSVSSASISVVLPRPMTDIVVRGLEREVIGELGGGELEVERDVAAIAVIGEGMKGTPGVASKVFTAVAEKGINVRMIAQGSSELNISFVVKERDADEAVRAVHEAFIG